VGGWPEHACRGCSMVADQVAHVAHLNGRDTTLVFASRAPQTDIERLKARMGWAMPWYTMKDGFDTEFGVDEWPGTNAFIRDGDRVFRTYFINNRGDEVMGAPGVTSTSPRSDARRSGRTRRRATRRPRRTHGGTGTTNTATPRDRCAPTRGAATPHDCSRRDRSRRRRPGRGDPFAVGERGRGAIAGGRLGHIACATPTEPATRLSRGRPSRHGPEDDRHLRRTVRWWFRDHVRDEHGIALEDGFPPPEQILDFDAVV
jgi:hypothetical protein